MSTATLFPRTTKEALEDEIDACIIKMVEAQKDGDRRRWMRLNRERARIASKLARINQPDLPL